MAAPYSKANVGVLGVSASAVVHAAGNGADALWFAVQNGSGGLTRNNLSWCDLPCWIGEVPEVAATTLPEALASWDCRNNRLAWMALQDASFREAASISIARHGAHRVGLILGTSTSGIRSAEIAYAERRATGTWPTQFHYRQSQSADSLCRFTASVLHLEGPMVSIATACSSSAKVFLTAKRWIELGIVDAVIVGGADSLCLSTLHGFDSLQLLSPEICRPFDASRNGISIGEAAGFILLEREASEINFLGGGESSDAWHMSTPHPTGQGAQDAMRGALAAAGLAAADIGYVNAHGTATLANDRAEAAALVAVFGDHGVPVSSTKGITGHTLGAAGIVEVIVVTNALARQTLPTCANLLAADPELRLDLIEQSRPAKLRYAMSNNFGFGGSNCALIFGTA